MRQLHTKFKSQAESNSQYVYDTIKKAVDLADNSEPITCSILNDFAVFYNNKGRPLDAIKLLKTVEQKEKDRPFDRA